MESSSGTSSCRGLYTLYVCLFYIWSLFASLMGLKHQKILQVTAFIAKMIIFLLMFITSIGLIYSYWYYNGNDWIYNSSLSIPNYGNNIKAFNISSMPYMIAVASFAYGNQFCTTDIIQPLSYNDKNNANKQHKLWASVASICTLYILCGIPISLYFGSNTDSP